MSDATSTAVVTVTPPGADSPIALGTMDATGIVPQGITLTADTHGPTSCGFTLARDTLRAWPDIQAGFPLDVHIDNTHVWGGRITGAPASGRNQLGVTAEGWQYHLDDDQVLFGGVSGTPQRAFDQKTASGVNNAVYIPAGLVDIGQTITIGFAQGTVLAAGQRVGVTWDAGEGRVFAACSLDYTISAANVNLQLSVPSHPTAAQQGGTNSAGAWSGTAMTTPAATGTVTSTYGTANRYVTLFINAPAGFTATGHHTIKITAARFASVSSYLSSGASVLKASTIVATALQSAPLLDQGTTGIQATSFDLPDFWPKDHTTPRQLIDGANTYHGWVWRVTPDRRLIYEAQPGEATLQIGAWSGAQFNDQSTASLADLYNKVIVEYTNSDGVDAKTERTATNGVLTTIGVTRTQRLSTGMKLSLAAAEAIGDVWLTQHTTPKLAGSFQATTGSVRDINGGDIPPHLLLGRVNELVRVGSPDPTTASPDREGRVVQVTYTHDDRAAAVSLDTTTSNLEAFLGRLQVVQGGK